MTALSVACELIISYSLRPVWMTGFCAALQQRKLNKYSNICAARAYSTKIEFTVRARSGHTNKMARHF
jgi:hypothetical protein